MYYYNAYRRWLANKTKKMFFFALNLKKKDFKKQNVSGINIQVL